jgi:hypothetical protein
MKRIMIGQQTDRELQRRITSGKFSTRIGTKIINGGTVTTIDGRVWVPKDAQQRIVDWYHANFSMPGSLERSILLARHSLGKGYERWLRSTFSAATVANVTRLRIRNPTVKFNLSQLSAIEILGRWSILIAAALEKLNGMLRSRVRSNRELFILFLWWRHAPVGANSFASDRLLCSQWPRHLIRHGYVATLNLTKLYMTMVRNLWVANFRRCLIATASSANLQQ